MHAGFTTGNNVCRHQRRQATKPKTGGLDLTMPELPRLDNLVRLSHMTADDGYRVFKSDARDRRIQQTTHEFESLLLHTRSTFRCKVTSPRHGKMRTGRMRHHQVPTIANNVKNVTLVMSTRRFSRKQVTRHSVMSESAESIAHPPAVLTSDKHPHVRPQVCCWRKSEISSQGR